jgi:hypothetical protein
MPGKMAGSDPRPSVRITRGAGSGQYLASVLQEGRENTNIMPVWDSSGESRLMARRHSIKLARSHNLKRQLPRWTMQQRALASPKLTHWASLNCS